MGVTEKHYYHENNTDIVFGRNDYVCPSVWRWQLPANQSSSSSAICKCSVQDGICRDLGHSVCGNRDPRVQERQCNTEYKKQCVPKQRQECQTVYKSVCNTEYQQVCNQKYRDETEYYTETECNTDYKQDCEYQWEGTGNNKVWAPIQGTCKKNAYDKCEDVQKQRLKQVPYNDCNTVPKKVCNDVPKQECRTVTEQSCSQVPYQNCQNVPRQECQTVHKKVPQRVSSQVAKKVCNDGASYGATGERQATGGGVKIRSDAPEKQVKPKNADAVNFGR